MKTNLILLALLSLTGCQTALNSDKIVSVKVRTFGLTVGQNPINQTPEIKLGFSSVVYQMIPTSTNGIVYAPKYADSFELKQGINPFATGIDETTGTGDVYLGDGTNVVSQAIIPAVKP